MILMTVKELQKKLKGHYDLTNAVDCQSVIRMLLVDLERAKKRADAAFSELRMLALLVSREKPTAKSMAGEVLEGIPMESAAKVMDAILAMCGEIKRAKALKDQEVADEVFRHVWGDLEMHSRGSAVLEELVLRFKKQAGLADFKSE